MGNDDRTVGGRRERCERHDARQGKRARRAGADRREDVVGSARSCSRATHFGDGRNCCPELIFWGTVLRFNSCSNQWHDNTLLNLNTFNSPPLKTMKTKVSVILSGRMTDSRGPVLCGWELNRRWLTVAVNCRRATGDVGSSHQAPKSGRPSDADGSLQSEPPLTPAWRWGCCGVRTLVWPAHRVGVAWGGGAGTAGDQPAGRRPTTAVAPPQLGLWCRGL